MRAAYLLLFAAGHAVAQGTTSQSCMAPTSVEYSSPCYAAVTVTIRDGASAVLPNSTPGFVGETTLRCTKGKIVIERSSCRSQDRLLGSTTRSTVSATTGSDYLIGVYYYGGWKDNQVGAASSKPWEKIRGYKDREPALGFYSEDSSGVLPQQLKWMHEYGIDFVVFNWYWARHNAPMLAHAVDAYRRLPQKEGVKYAIQWSNHTDYNYSRSQLQSLFRYWATNYFRDTDYQQLNGKPVVYIFNATVLKRNAASLGMSTAQVLDMAEQAAKEAGLPGLSVVGGLWGGDKSLDYSERNGFAAFTMYNYHSPANIALQPPRPGNQSRSFAELSLSYKNQWEWMVKNTKPTFIVPMTAGWDRRPWGGSKDPLHDNSRATPEEFAAHLGAARAFMDANPARTQKMGVICCWNEIGEGSFIEPTKSSGPSYLNQVRDTFGVN